MSAKKKQFKIKEEVRVKNEFVEIKDRDGLSTIIFAIDERGMPHFPERIKRKLPPYVMEMAQRTIHHKLWCADFAGVGIMCNCDDPRAMDDELCCVMCSKKPSMEKIDWQYPIGETLKLRWTNDGEKLYWVVTPDLTGFVNCGQCLREHMEVEFSRMDQLSVKNPPNGSESTKKKSRLSVIK